jgi:protein-tyrosine-phosphatase
MRVGFICRKNQIRSPFAASITSSIFPEVETFSAGTDADLDSSFHPRAVNLAKEWGIAMISDPSTGLDAAKHSIRYADLVVAAEDELLIKISPLPIHGILTSFTEIAMDSDFVPIDPIGMTEHEFKIQMSKVAHIAIRSVCRDIYNQDYKSIYAITPVSENIFELALAKALFEAAVREGIVIYVDFRAYLNALPDEISIIRFNPEKFEVATFATKSKNTIFLPDREVTSPEKLYLSRNWIDLIFQLSAETDVILLTPPIYLETGKIYDSYLASSIAEKITVINA